MTQVIPKVLPWNHTKVLCSREKGGYAFNYKLPKEGLTLRSVRITNGVPELVFAPARNVPTIQEDEVATVFRLVHENERPCFFYFPFPPFHPLQGRWYKHYSPEWLRGNSVGKQLADADWNMKCLQVGARSNEEKTVFQSWAFSSKLDGIASSLDFPSDATSGSIIMSCDHVKVQMNEDEIIFPEDPKIIITAETSKLYSKYISDILPSVAYHDEPKFLKIPELVKLIVAVEWLCKDKKVQIDEEWFMKQTTKAADVNGGASEDDVSEMPPRDMVPQLLLGVQPKTDVQVKTWEAGKNASVISKCGTERMYGQVDFHHCEEFLFKEDGTRVLTPRSLKFRVHNNPPLTTVIDRVSLSDEVKRSDLPVTKSTSVALSDLKQKEGGDTLQYSASNYTDIEDSVERPTSPHQDSATGGPVVKESQGVVATVDDFDLLYEGIDPSWPILLGEGKITKPDVKTWKELITEYGELPPYVIQSPYCELIEPMCSGGVSTQQIPIHQMQSSAEHVREPVKSRHGVYSATKSKISVQAITNIAAGRFLKYYKNLLHLKCTMYTD